MINAEKKQEKPSIKTRPKHTEPIYIHTLMCLPLDSNKKKKQEREPSLPTQKTIRNI